MECPFPKSSRFVLEGTWIGEEPQKSASPTESAWDRPRSTLGAMDF